jgi:hypothetical protein
MSKSQFASGSVGPGIRYNFPGAFPPFGNSEGFQMRSIGLAAGLLLLIATDIAAQAEPTSKILSLPGVRATTST